MEREPFFSFLSEASRKNRSLLCVGIDPQPGLVPAGELVSFAERLMQATKEAACAYSLSIAFYEARGVEGLAALPAIVDDIHGAGFPVILDAKRGDIATSAAAYAQAAFEAWGADAVTVNPLLGGDAVESFSSYLGRGVFVLCHTSNPGVTDLLELEEAGVPLYERIAALAESWNTRGNIGLVIGATFPTVLERVRRIVPDMWFLLPDVGPQGGDLEQKVSAGLTAEGSGVLVNVSQDISASPDPRATALEYRDRINEARAMPRRTSPAGGAKASTTLARDASVSDALREEVSLGLHRLGAVRFGAFTLKSGLEFPLCLDLRLLVSDQKLMALVARAMAGLLSGIRFDRIAAIPYGGLLIGLAVSLESRRPLIYLREAEEPETMRAIEGLFGPGETAIVLSDMITTGASTIAAVETLREAGLVVRDVVVLVDNEQSGERQLTERGVTLHSVLTISRFIDTLARGGRISEAVRADVFRALAHH